MWAIYSQMVFNFVFIVVLFVTSVRLQKANANDNNGEKPQHPFIYNVGGVLSSNESEAYFATTISVSTFV